MATSAAKAKKVRRTRASAATTTDPNLGAVSTLRDFLATAGQLTMPQRETIVEQALVLIDDLYVHLPLKRAMHAVEPVQRLRLLQKRLTGLSERQFHDEMIDIFTDLRDLHTNYVLPAPYRSKTAFLPFLMEEHFEGAARRYVVSKTFEGFTHATFQAGVRILSWNGIPIGRAVEVNAERNAGSNADARLARGLESMTIRPMAMSAPPDEEWVILGYQAGAQTLEIKLDWQVFAPDPAPNGVDPADVGGGGAALGIDYLTEGVRRAKKALFAKGAMDKERAARRRGRAGGVGALNLADTSTLPDVLSFRSVTTPSGTFGYLRIWTFMVGNVETFLNEAIRIIGLLPQNGLIIDVRGNGGGIITAGERLLQLFTPKRIVPERLHFLNTPLTLQLVRANPFLAEWEHSMELALETGADFSQGFPIEAEENANLLGQKYHGPVVLITDALCYSTTDIFAAGFQDHEIGPVLGVAGHTGAGGANVWDHDLLLELLPGPESPIQPLPNGASMRVSIRRTTRVGKMAGVPVEDLGVERNVEHKMTRADLFEDNKDLIHHAGQLLAAGTARVLTGQVVMQGGLRKLNLTTKGLNRVDVFVAGRPRASLDVVDGARVVDLPASGSVRLEGYGGGALVAARRV